MSEPHINLISFLPTLSLIVILIMEKRHHWPMILASYRGLQRLRRMMIMEMLKTPGGRKLYIILSKASLFNLTL
jgi:hypothetical protein